MKTEMQPTLHQSLKGIKVENGKLVTANGYLFAVPVLHDIVTAVNAYGPMLEALKTASGNHTEGMGLHQADIQIIISKAIARAVGK